MRYFSIGVVGAVFVHTSVAADLMTCLSLSLGTTHQSAMDVEVSSQEGTLVETDKPFRHTKPEAVVSKLYSYQLESLTWMTVHFLAPLWPDQHTPLGREILIGREGGGIG